MGDHEPTEQCDPVGDDGQHRDHDHRGHQSRGDQFLDGVRPFGPERVDLLGDLHGRQLGGDAGTDPSGDHEGGEHRAEFPYDGRADQAGDVLDRAVRLELDGPLQGQDHAGEDPRQEDDEQRARSDLVHVVERVPEVPGTPERATERGRTELRKFLDC